ITAMILFSNELWYIRQIETLLLLTQSKETVNHIPRTIHTATQALIAPAIEGIEPIVNGNFLTLSDVFPGEHVDPLTHGVGITSMIVITARWKQKGAGLPIQFA